MTAQLVGYAISAIVLNATIVWLLAFIRQKPNLKAALNEKHGSRSADGSEAAREQTSYSRVAGALGAFVLAASLWALANWLIYAAFWAPDTISPVLDGVGNFFLAGSSLFAPYAFNQLASVFRGSAGWTDASGAMAAQPPASGQAGATTIST